MMCLKFIIILISIDMVTIKIDALSDWGEQKTITLNRTTVTDEQLQLQLNSLHRSITYKLYTRDLQEPLLLTYDNWNTTKEHFKFDKEVKIVTHGWLSNGESKFAASVKDAYLASDDLNVIIVDWSSVSSNIVYTVPMLYTKSVGQHYGKFLNYLVDSGLNLNKLHLIGHSLGAHVSGFGAREIITGKPKRLTALDPALPGFPPKLTSADHITSTDASFVDVIHSCGGVLGILSAIGHADFYPNFGISPQPGCLSIGKESLSCSHSRSWVYFVESINREHVFNAKKCKSWFHYLIKSGEQGPDVAMGDPCPLTARGIYSLKTNSQSPFAQGI